jgi:hypothetical protein
MVRGSATAVPRKILIPGFIFPITVSGETIAASQLLRAVDSIGLSHVNISGFS